MGYVTVLQHAFKVILNGRMPHFCSLELTCRSDPGAFVNFQTNTIGMQTMETKAKHTPKTWKRVG